MSTSYATLKTKPLARPQSIVGGKDGLKYRFTILDTGLIRYEYAHDGVFEDRASTFAINRELPTPQFRVNDSKESLEIITDRFVLQYNKQDFSVNGLNVLVRGNITDWHSKWKYSDHSDDGWQLGGTARTLDGADGRIAVGPSFTSRNGFANLDDSQTMLFTDDGWVSGRRPGHRIDGYLFAYGLDYKAAAKAFYSLSGSQPLLPRWSLGNWWSRYYDYTTESYLALMDRFTAEQIPLSVAVIDMGWHWVDDKRVHETGLSGWTGYSWNTKLFPDPKEFLDELHKRNLKATLNDHPADGIASFEECYKQACDKLGRDMSNKDTIPFEAADKSFLDAYFGIVLRKLEDEGVDFWWVDWQQGETSAMKGVDPLWVLNHFHFMFNASEKRPITFSRYAGPGSHRYPVGFSGDSVVTWESLDFQPEFTATSSNIGYGWWSHDIGGHMNGYKDDELETRWVQLGVFSPILRLHSNNNPWNSKEPWKYNDEACQIQKEALRLRHRLIPYMYTMNVRSARDDEPLIQPVYWHFPRTGEAYNAKNTFFFGSEMLVVPMTSRRSTSTRRSRTRAWLPPGRWVDFFSGIVYDGDRELYIHRDLHEYAVFCCEGAIIPLDGAQTPGNGGDNPECVEIVVVVGADGSFDLLEDDGSGSTVEDVKFSSTRITFSQDEGLLTIDPGSSSQKREWKVKFLSLAFTGNIKAQIDGNDAALHLSTDKSGTCVSLKTPSSGKVKIRVGENSQLANTDVSQHVFKILHEAQMDYNHKSSIWNALEAKAPFNNRLSRLQGLNPGEDLLGAISEIVLADGRSQDPVRLE
ncbi:hypothetical protein MBLNU459_g2006t2 [Dothideomycetes sp. NU459]